MALSSKRRRLNHRDTEALRRQEKTSRREEERSQETDSLLPPSCLLCASVSLWLASSSFLRENGSAPGLVTADDILDNNM
jgi:hypothetical protein